MPDSDLDLLTQAAVKAGRIALSYWRKSPKVWDKGAEHGPVTEADLAVNTMLHDSLRLARPAYGWLSEETPDDPGRLACEALFIIDPIDGTRAFVAGEATFCHSLAIARQGRVVAGVVYLPALDRLYAASIGAGATVNGTPIQGSLCAALTGAHILTTKPNLAPERWPGGVPEVTRSFRASLAYRLCLAAEGAFDGMITLIPAWEWDIAAGSLIATRAGLTVTTRTGSPLTFNTPFARNDGILALPPAAHAEAMGRLGPG